jgi:hypothetical protein
VEERARVLGERAEGSNPRRVPFSLSRILPSIRASETVAPTCLAGLLIEGSSQSATSSQQLSCSGIFSALA